MVADWGGMEFSSGEMREFVRCGWDYSRGVMGNGLRTRWIGQWSAGDKQELMAQKSGWKMRRRTRNFILVEKNLLMKRKYRYGHT